MRSIDKIIYGLQIIRDICTEDVSVYINGILIVTKAEIVKKDIERLVSLGFRVNVNTGTGMTEIEY